MQVTILMSTYNGEKYIREQINSIYAQKNVKVKLIVRDDGSTDGTVKILKEYLKDGLTIIEGKNEGPCQSFLELISSNCNDEYYALADQDDIWDVDKLEKAVKILSKENQQVPLLYFSNLRLVDSQGNYFRNAHSYSIDVSNKFAALADDRATGCTIVYNRKLAELVFEKKPKEYSMHDAWLYTICSLFGKVVYDFQPHISYRQHSNNVVGISIKENRLHKKLQQLSRLFNKALQPRYNNAIIINKYYGDILDKESKEKIEKIIRYKHNIRSKISLLLDKDIVSDKYEKNIRLRILIILGLF